MANKRTSMVIQEEIQRLKELSHSQRKVSEILGIHRSTVKKYWSSVEEAQAEPAPSWCNDLDWDYLKNELIKRKTPKKILFEELSLTHQLPSYSSFCRMMAKRLSVDKSPIITVRINRPPGESVEVDYSGESIDIICPATGEIMSTELFVGTMSYSNKIYAEFTESQKLEDWIASHVRMFKFLGGTPRYIISDNLKSGVTRADKYDPEINRTYNDLARHYQIAVDPADKASPKQKPNVERSVKLLQNDFFPRIRNQTFTSVYELNQCLREYLENKNNELMKERGGSRNTFFEKERSLLRELPENDYEICYWKKVKIHPDCHFQLKYCYYSVPYQYVGKELDIKYSSKFVYVYHNLKQVCSYPLCRGRGHRVTNKNHYPEKKIVHMQMNIKNLEKKAKKIGPNMESMLERLLIEPRYPLKNLRKCQAIIDLNKKHLNEVMEFAAEKCLLMERLNYYFFKACAENYKPKPTDNVERAPTRQIELICLQGGNYE